MSDLPVACTLGPSARRARREGLLADLIRRAVAHDALTNGHRFQFEASGDIVPAIMRVVDTERLCCRFLHFHIAIQPDEGPITLVLTGPPGTREFLDALFEP